jgi:phosphoribosylformylglycinamidine synthase
VVGGVGLIEDLDKVATLKGAQPGDVLVTVQAEYPTGEELDDLLGASLYSREILGVTAGSPPRVDLGMEQSNADFVRSLIVDGLINAVHDISDGGILCAVTEAAMASGVGAQLNWNVQDLTTVEFLFNERQSEYVLAVSPEHLDSVLKRAGPHPSGIPRAPVLGSFSGDKIAWDDSGSVKGSISLSRLREAHEGWLPTYMNAVD